MAMGGGPGVVNLGINASGFLNTINTIVNSTTNYNTAIGQVNVQINNMAAVTNNAAGGIGRLNGMLGALAAAASIQGLTRLYGQFQQASQEAAAFSRSIGLIQTITADSNMSFNQWADGIRKVSDELGMPLAETSAAAYDLLSNQVTKAADTFQVLAVAGNLANLTNASVTDSVNVLSSVINAYGLSSRDAEGLAAKLFTTVDLGRVKLSEVANTIGRVAETGKSLGVTNEEINAGMIAITQTGVKTDTAMTLLTNVFQKLIKPTRELQAYYDELGVSTGENFIKINGLAGAVELLDKKTGGSTAAVQKFFNEIRGSQGFQILKDQAKAFNTGLAEQETALERARAARVAYENTPGFKFQKESQQFTNEMVVGFKTEMLNLVMKVTEAFGGLKGTLVGATAAAGTLAAGVATYQVAVAASTVTTAALGAAVGAIAWPATLAVGAAAFMAILLKQIQAAEAAKSLYRDLGTYWEAAAQKASAEDGEQIARDVEKTKAALAEKQKAVLAYAAEQRKTLNSIGDGLETVGDRMKAGLKNAVELVLKSAKDALKEIESRLSRALAAVEAARKSQKDVPGNRGDALYEYAKAKDQATGGDGAKRILQERIDRLGREMADAAARGDKDAFDKASSKQESLVREASTATDENGNLLHTGQLEAINELYANQLAYLDQIAAVNQRNADILEKQKETVARQVQRADDAGKALYDFDITDKKGNQRFGSKEELRDEVARLKKEFDESVKDLNRNPNAGNEYRGANALGQQAAMTTRMRDLEAQWDRFAGKGGNREQAQGNLEQKNQLTATEGALSKLLDVAIKRLNETADKAQAASLNAGRARAQSNQALGAILGEGEGTGNLFASPKGHGWRRADEAQLQAQLHGLARDVNENADKGDYAAAQQGLKKMEAFLRGLGNFQKEVMTSGRTDADGNLLDKTPQAALNHARERLANRQKADGEAGSARGQFDDQLTATPRALDTVGDAIKKWKDLDAKAQGVSGARVDDATGKVGDSFSKFRGLDDQAKGLTAERVNAAMDALAAMITRAAAEAERAKALAESAAHNARVTAEHDATGNAQAPASGRAQGGFGGYFNSGGEARGIDTQTVRVDPREFIMNPQSSMRFKSQLTAMNQGHDPSGSPQQAGSTNVGDIHISVHGGPTAPQTIDAIASGLQRGIRRGTIRLGR